MKLLFNFLIVSNYLLLAQVPQGFTYQAVATDSNGLELVEQNVSLRVTILSESSSGIEQWIETHATSTDGFGLFTITIGEGTSTGNGVQSSFPDIDWGDSEHHLKIEMDVNGGSDYQLLGISQLMSVPYALYAENSNSNNLELIEQGNTIDSMLLILDSISNNSSSQNNQDYNSGGLNSNCDLSLSGYEAIVLGTNATIEYSQLKDSTYYVLFHTNQNNAINGIIHDELDRVLVCYDLDANILWYKIINTDNNALTSNQYGPIKFKIEETDDFTFVLIRNAGGVSFQIQNEYSTNQHSSIWKLDKTTGDIIDYTDNGISMFNFYLYNNEIFYINNSSNYTAINKSDFNFDNFEGVTTLTSKYTRVEVDYFNSVLYLINQEQTTQQLSISQYPLNLNENTNSNGGISIQSYDNLYPVYTITSNEIIVLSNHSQDETYFLKRYSTEDFSLINQDQYQSYNNTYSLNYIAYTAYSNLVSNFESNSFLLNLVPLHQGAMVCNYSLYTENFSYSGVNGLELKYYINNVQQYYMKEIKPYTIKYNSNGQNIYKIFTVRLDEYPFLGKYCFNNQIYGDSDVILIKDTF